MDPVGWSNFRWDLTAAVTFSFFNIIFNQLYIPIALRHGATELQVGLLAAAPAIGLLFSPLWAGWIENRNPRPFVVYPHVVARSLILIPAFYAEPWVFVAAALVFHLMMGLPAPAYASLMARIYPDDQRGRLMGNVRVAMGAFMIPLTFAAGYWLDHSGSQGPLIVASITGVLSVLALNRVRDLPSYQAAPAAVSRTSVSLREQIRLVKENRPLLIFLLATTLSGFGNMVGLPLFQIIQVDRLELTNVEIGTLRVAYTACLLVSYLIMGWVMDRYSPQLALCIAMALYTVVPLLYGFVGTYSSILIGSGLQGLSDAIWDIGILMFIYRIVPNREGIAFGLHLMLFGIRGSIGPMLSASVIPWIPIAAVLSGAACFCLLGFLLFLVYFYRRPAAG